MPVRPIGSHKPRRAIDDTDAFLECTTLPRRNRRSGRILRASIAVGAAGTVGLLALIAPGFALSASASNAPATTVIATAEPRPGTTDAFAARGSSVTRSVARTTVAVEDLESAAARRAESLAQVDDQVTHVQTESAALARSESLASTVSRIDSEARRLIEERTYFWPTEGEINSDWGMRLHPILRYTRLHGGADIGGAVGAPIYAVKAGIVTKAASGYNGGSGNNVRIDHGVIAGEHIESAYLHMDSLVVAEGQQVTHGQLIGYVGNTGLSTSAHLHLSFYVNGANSDPAPYLRGER